MLIQVHVHKHKILFMFQYIKLVSESGNLCLAFEKFVRFSACKVLSYYVSFFPSE